MILNVPITTLFLDIGGVLLSNGWGHQSRALAAKEFSLNLEEMEVRHHLTFDTYEEGKLTLEDYLGRTVFYEKRSFTKEQFRAFMFAQSQPFPAMIEMMRNFKKQHNLRVVVVSNEARELNLHRIQTFKLSEFVDCFISSCFVRLRKPDADIFRLALDVAQTPPEQILYIEDTPMFVQIAEGLGIRCILHSSYQSTSGQMAQFKYCSFGS